ncbi:hypothetical protein E4U43_002686 [Claviceps pusilla]|uniref:Uncharacterized protein n=1 Tax=Claviceps pusilla TaxID=123648 RepID=A0A9P7N768_9HYPO|nr:hypothetical protein E4U43_002686 [Claviceps pusilla]
MTTADMGPTAGSTAGSTAAADFPPISHGYSLIQHLQTPALAGKGSLDRHEKRGSSATLHCIPDFLPRPLWEMRPEDDHHVHQKALDEVTEAFTDCEILCATP